MRDNQDRPVHPALKAIQALRVQWAHEVQQALLASPGPQEPLAPLAPLAPPGPLDPAAQQDRPAQRGHRDQQGHPVLQDHRAPPEQRKLNRAHVYERPPQLAASSLRADNLVERNRFRHCQAPRLRFDTMTRVMRPHHESARVIIASAILGCMMGVGRFWICEWPVPANSPY